MERSLGLAQASDCVGNAITELAIPYLVCVHGVHGVHDNVHHVHASLPLGTPTYIPDRLLSTAALLVAERSSATLWAQELSILPGTGPGACSRIIIVGDNRQ